MHSFLELVDGLAAERSADACAEQLYRRAPEFTDALAGVVARPSVAPATASICAEVLGSVAPEGVLKLLELLRLGPDDVADTAAWGLRWNTIPELLEPELLRLLQHPAAPLRARSARALRYIHVDLRIPAADLLFALRDDNVDVRLDVLRTLLALAELGRVAPSARDAFMAVTSSRADASERESELVAEVLAALQSSR